MVNKLTHVKLFKNTEGEWINMATYAKPVNRAFVVKPSKAKEFVNHSSKREIEKIYSIANMFEDVFGKKRTKD